MAVGLTPPESLLPVPGIRLGTAEAGIKKPGRRDLVVIELAPGSHCAGLFTRNAFCAAPVVVARNHLLEAAPRYLVINTGNANAGTGQRGLDAAADTCRELAVQAGVTPAEVLPFSTGVIGEPLPLDRLLAGLPAALSGLDANGWLDAAAGIMTTDTVPKGISRKLSLGGREVTLTGIAKGAGMIRPDMATMLAFIGTDAGIEAPDLHGLLVQAAERSFNRITVDGDTSTNDALMLMASGASGVRLERGTPDWTAFAEALTEVFRFLAQSIVRDGEGATKFVRVEVSGGAGSAECLQVGYTVAHSPLVKTALFASDPNWGRILAAVGRAGLEDLALERVEIHLDDVCIVRGGGRAEDYTEAAGQRVLAQEEFAIRIDLGRGEASESVWTTDLSYDYVRINAEYRT
ncbi:bifunctional glutamate N-acetyltransferase/amino-acid acetyltransferase ArgJ [Thiohalobacter thiocyanaticus]|uniref:Arginine biosynthesis bifunctional protein ArgJ n=1 Tax=Thiohalobacter thiocyanaticus TaxID=585455 RepID=A0A426QMX7_9GAMM|nr:bifunctional glutamate N-acetyltransferase/amino-acid acetyltransferase ArgJ [Thiohalobacter thiocyanaticus]RRQ23123.1 bifunctional glutamate N-acetyltransferase/amino-acid acetyltransferase ArgJ [Thiohalobacter thiocyanaticus]